MRDVTGGGARVVRAERHYGGARPWCRAPVRCTTCRPPGRLPAMPIERDAGRGYDLSSDDSAGHRIAAGPRPACSFPRWPVGQTPCPCAAPMRETAGAGRPWTDRRAKRVPGPQALSPSPVVRPPRSRWWWWRSGGDGMGPLDRLRACVSLSTLALPLVCCLAINQ